MIKLKKIKQYIAKIPRILAEKAFVAFLILFVISSIFGALVFYKYSILNGHTEAVSTEKQLKFESKIYENVLSVWQDNEVRTQETTNKVYPNLFTPK